MKITNTRSLAIALVVVLAATGAQASGRDQAPASGLEIRYRIDWLPSLGGSSSIARGIDNRGRVAGRALLDGDAQMRAVLWRGGRLTDLGTLGGPNSAVMWPSKNVRGLVAGISQTGEPDPRNETWSCGFFFPTDTATGYRCVGFVWENGRLRELPTLGGTHGFATAANNLRQVVGWAETTVEDPESCRAPQQLLFRAVLWGPREEQVRELVPLPGHRVSAATAINDRGQTVGISGQCGDAFGGVSAIAAVLWEKDGTPVDLGSFGGVAWNTPMAINLRGDVVGFANASAGDGETFNPRAFLWTRGQPMRNLGMLRTDHTSSQASGVNQWRQVVGTSCIGRDCRAFVWQHGKMQDLNDLASVEDGITLTAANDIDDFGRIAGQAVEDATGDIRAFTATPYPVVGR